MCRGDCLAKFARSDTPKLKYARRDALTDLSRASITMQPFTHNGEREITQKKDKVHSEKRYRISGLIV
jgi:hypothetical protein